MAELSVGVRELKTHLSEYLRRIKQGEVIVITEHGKPIGQLMPAILSTEAKMQAMVDAGLAQWSGKKVSPAKPLAKWRGTVSIAELIGEDRE